MIIESTYPSALKRTLSFNSIYQELFGRVNTGIGDFSTMQPEGDFENIVKDTPLPERMPNEGYVGNTSNGKAWGKVAPHDVAEIDKEMKKLNIQQRISAENAVLGMSAEATAIWNQYQDMLSSTVDTNKAYPDLAEDDEKLKKVFKELDKHLRIIERERTNPDYAAYKLAREQNPKFIDNYLFKIDFLRAENYNPRRAALRILRYLSEKLELFGRDKLTRVIYWDDLGDDAIAFFRRGALQLLPDPDLHGRRILFAQGKIKRTAATDEEIFTARKAYFYFWTAIAEHDTEKGKLLGIAVILWKVHSPRTAEARSMEAIRKVWQCSPTKVSAYHVCQRWPPVDAGSMKLFAFRFISWFKNSGDLRLVRAHHGKPKKCTKVLVEEYGCPNDSLSKLTENPSYKDFIEQWILERQKIDSQMELLVESIKSVGSSTMSPNSTVLAESMSKQGSSMNNTNISISLQSANQRVLNELTTSSLKLSFGESDLSMRASDLLRHSRFSSGSLGRHSFSSLPWMKGAEQMSLDDSIEDIVNEALEESVSQTPNSNSRNGFGFLTPPDWIGGKPNEDIKYGNEYNGNIATEFTHENDIDDRDIKLGRGKPLQRHPGNIWFRNLIKAKFAEYDRAEKSRQTQMSLETVEIVAGDGRRFLVAQPKQKGYWREITVAEAREKVAINFRTERKRRKKHQFAW